MNKTLLAAALAACALGVQAAPKKLWITVGDDGYAQLQRIAPQFKAQDSRPMAFSDAGLTEQVHIVEVDDTVLHPLSDATHEELHRCSGFMAHRSYADAVRALQAAAPSAQTRPSYAIDNQDEVRRLMAGLSERAIGDTIVGMSRFLNRYYQSPHGVEASNWLMKQWQGLAQGRNDVTVEQFAHADWKQKSVVLTIRGQRNPDEIIVLGAHLDSIHKGSKADDMVAPGADDDASGIASLTDVLRQMMAKGYKPNRTIKIIGYAAEEVGLRGSQDIAAKFKAQNANVVGVMQLDMTNYKGDVNDIYLFSDYTDSEQNTFLANLIRTYQPELKIGEDRCGYGCSDHASWNRLGYRASMPFEASFKGMNHKIHTENDTFENMGSQASHALKFARLAMSYAVELGSDGATTPPPGGNTGGNETKSGSLRQGDNSAFGPYRLQAGNRIEATLSGQGDADLYLRNGAAPTLLDWDCRPYRGDSDERCVYTATSASDIYLMLNAYRDASYVLKVQTTGQTSR